MLTPFNLDVLVLNKAQLMQMRQVKDMVVFENASKNFSPDGLFSTQTFGNVGSTERNQLFGYIDLHTDILHPFVYKTLVSLRGLYEDIAAGKAYVLFDNDKKDFVLSTPEKGKTGYDYLLKHIDKIDFGKSDSDMREARVEFVTKYSVKSARIGNYIVMPAGLRDYTIDESGQPSEDEVNSLYRIMISISKLIENIKVDEDDISTIDMIRYRLQKSAVNLYDYIFNLLDGKHKLIQGKWTKRTVAFGTRNVITATPINIKDLDDEHIITFNHTVCGLYQYLAAINPILKNALQSKFTNRIFEQSTNTATLVDPETLRTRYVEVSSKQRDAWVTDDGIDTLIYKMKQDELRGEDIMVDDYYFSLIYDDGKNIEVIDNTDTLPEGLDTKYLRPIKYSEMLYIAVHDIVDKYPGLITRFPVTGLGSIYPTKIYLKTTSNGRKVNLRKNGQTIAVLPEYPIFGESYTDALSPHYSRIGRLGGDFSN